MRLLLAALACLIAGVASAQGAAVFENASKETREAGEAYFAAYIARDWDRLAPLLAENGGFTDPTAALVFGAVQAIGKAKTLENFRRAYASLEYMRFARTRAFFSGHYAVFEGTLDWALNLQGGQQARVDAMPFVVVLKVEGKLITEHRDFADYHPFLAAMPKRPAAPKAS